MADIAAETHRDPLDATMGGAGAGGGPGWECPICSVELPKEATYCQMCLYARPMDRRGVPQIFAGYAIHFNGIIPRTLIHPSHSVEWRMAERHGAVCLAKFDPTTVNLLVYRPGYERSEKCRVCVERYTNIPAVPITWMLDSLLQSRQIHPSLYRLSSIPGVANPTVRGTELPHHQHPYYLLNKSEYGIPTSFPETKRSANQQALKVIAGKGISMKDIDLPPGMDVNIPPFFDIDPPQYTNVNVYDAVISCASGKNKADRDNDNDEIEARKDTASIDLIASQQQYNKVDKLLFSGCNIVLSPALEKNPRIAKAMEACGAKIIPAGPRPEDTLKSEATHVIYAHQDKKCDIVVIAAALKSGDLPGLQMAQSNWVEDCFIMGEMIPLYGMYVPTPKLMETLNKKYGKSK